MGPAMQTGQQRRQMYGQPQPPPPANYPPAQGAPPSYGNPPGYQSPFNPAQHGQPNVPYTENDIAQQWKNNRNDFQNEGGIIAGQNNQFGNNEDWNRNYYRNLGDPVAQEMLAGRGGYTPEEMDRINREGGYRSGMTTDAGYDSLNPTGDEASGMTGNTHSYADYFDPANMDATDRDSATFQRAQLSQADTRQGEAIDQQATALHGAIDPNKLGYDPNSINKALSAGDSRIAGSYDPNDIRQSQDFVNRYRMSDRDVNDLTQQAATTQGNLTQAHIDQLKQSAAASGYNSPMALAAAMGRMHTTSDAQAGDQMTNARIAARHEQAGREQQIEQERLGAEQGLARMNEGQNETIAGRDLNTAQSNEQQRLNAERGITGMNIDAANTVAGNRLDSARYTGTAGAGMEAGIGRQASGTQQFITNTGTGIREQQDQAAVDRASRLYGVRQGNTQYAQQQKYNQNTGVNDRLSNTNLQGANMRINQTNSGLGYVAGQQGMANTNVNNTLNRGVSLYGTKGQLMNGATSGNSQWEAANQGNTPFAKTLKTINTITGVANAYNGRQ